MTTQRVIEVAPRDIEKVRTDSSLSRRKAVLSAKQDSINLYALSQSARKPIALTSPSSIPVTGHISSMKTGDKLPINLNNLIDSSTQTEGKGNNALKLATTFFSGDSIKRFQCN